MSKVALRSFIIDEVFPGGTLQDKRITRRRAQCATAAPTFSSLGSASASLTLLPMWKIFGWESPSLRALGMPRWTSSTHCILVYDFSEIVGGIEGGFER